MPPEDHTLLSKSEIFVPLSEEDLRDLGRRVPDMGLAKGQLFYSPWHRGESCFVLLEGRMRIYRLREAREVTISVVQPGQLFGEAALAGLRQGSYAQALESARVAILGRKTLRALVTDRPQVGVKVMELLAWRLNVHEDRLEEIGLLEIPARLACLLVRMVEDEGVPKDGDSMIPTHYTHQILATMVGCERPALTRALGELREEGAIWLSERRIHVADLGILKVYAGRY
ncbi:Crp/Fnr family transcriptional regulator [Rubrobacter aplysinae]|uniref:Crp/Fnr family transcriptional regulator n=1 Tax=Rubrobacter aplysinae TaxID=909625 RepID=UPI00064B8321|nr:Crp/Fnr family transcriptional regulator [Rubrobacter aplysinae]